MSTDTRRNRNAKIVATLGPASADREKIEALFHAGADVFRLNFSHGTHDDHKQRLDTIRAIERDLGRPIGVLLDLQGPKLRIGTFAGGPIQLEAGDASGSISTATSRATRPAPHCRIRKSSPRSAAARTFCSTTARCACASSAAARTSPRRGSSTAARSRTARASTSPAWCCRSRH